MMAVSPLVSKGVGMSVTQPPAAAPENQMSTSKNGS